MFKLAYGKARGTLLDYESGNSPVAFGFIGHRYDDVDVSLTAVCDKAFAAVQYPMVTFKDRTRFLSCRIRAGIGFCQGKSAKLFALC